MMIRDRDVPRSYLGGLERDLTKLSIWKAPVDGSSVEKLIDNCRAVWDAAGRKYLISSQSMVAHTIGVSEFSLDHKCTRILPELNTLNVHFPPSAKQSST
jgi:hypothetical protein